MLTLHAQDRHLDTQYLHGGLESYDSYRPLCHPRLIGHLSTAHIAFHDLHAVLAIPVVASLLRVHCWSRTL